MTKLTLRNIEKRFGNFTAVTDFNMELKEGEFVSLLGPSGCGKTTTLRLIAGFLRPDEGSIEMEGRMLSSAAAVVQPEHRHMSMIFQSYAIWPNMTVFENVAFGLKIKKISTAEVKRRVGEILEITQMAMLAERYPAELSGGQQQRVALARAIVVQPEVLLMDEPLSNLDANLREEMRYEIRRLHDEFQITTVYVTHDQAEAMVTSDRIAVMNKSRIEQLDEPFKIYSEPKTRFVAGFIGRTNFLKGRVQGNDMVFDGFAIPVASLAQSGSVQDKALASVRPQNIVLHQEKPDHKNGAVLLQGRVVQRGYLGEHWDYTVSLESGDAKLRVTTPPQQQFQLDEVIWLEIAPQGMALIDDL